jgi:endonuclease/exonuclease/phosphatase family metal-dependent hydrolase
LGKGVAQIKRERRRIYSAHLYPSDDAIRARETEEVLTVIEADTKYGLNFIFQGDLNHEPIQDEYGRWTEAGLTDCYAAKGVEQRNTIKRIFLNRTVDYLWINETSSKRLLRCKVLLGNFRANLLDGRSFALSDHLAVIAKFT